DGSAGRRKRVRGERAELGDRRVDDQTEIGYHGEAADDAGSRVAHKEIRLQLKAALHRLQSQPESPKRLLRELPLLHELGWTSVAIDGWGDKEAFRVFTRMRELAERLEDSSMRSRALESLRA